MLIQISEPVINKTMKQLFFIVFVFFSSQSFAQTVNWQQAHGWRLYNLRDKKGMRVRVDSLQQYNSVMLDDDSVKYFLLGATEIHHGDEPVWMGAVIISCIDSSGDFRKIDVSV